MQMRGPIISVRFYKTDADFDLWGINADRLYLPIESIMKAGVKKSVTTWRNQVYTGTAGVGSKSACVGDGVLDVPHGSAYSRTHGDEFIKEVFASIPAITGNSYYKDIGRCVEADSSGIMINGTKIDGFLIGGIGTLQYLKSLPQSDKIKIVLDSTANAYNSYTIGEYAKMGAHGVALSTELGMGNVTEMTGMSPVPVEVMAYGRHLMMTSEHCPIGDLKGCTQAKKRYTCQNGGWVLRDRIDASFPIICDPQCCRSYIFNSQTLFLDRELKMLKKAGVASLRLDFTTEGRDEIMDIINLYRDMITEGESPNEQRNRAVAGAIRKKGFTRGYFSENKKT
jgi:putative protease